MAGLPAVFVDSPRLNFQFSCVFLLAILSTKTRKTSRAPSIAALMGQREGTRRADAGHLLCRPRHIRAITRFFKEQTIRAAIGLLLRININLPSVLEYVCTTERAVGSENRPKPRRVFCFCLFARRSAKNSRLLARLRVVTHCCKTTRLFPSVAGWYLVPKIAPKGVWKHWLIGGAWSAAAFGPDRQFCSSCSSRSLPYYNTRRHKKCSCSHQSKSRVPSWCSYSSSVVEILRFLTIFGFLRRSGRRYMYG